MKSENLPGLFYTFDCYFYFSPVSFPLFLNCFDIWYLIGKDSKTIDFSRKLMKTKNRIISAKIITRCLPSFSCHE